MIVCMCNGLRERACREAAANGRCRGVGCIYRELGCRVRCGLCVHMMREIFRNHGAAAAFGGAERAAAVVAAPER